MSYEKYYGRLGASSHLHLHIHDDDDDDVNFSISESRTFTKIKDTRKPNFTFYVEQRAASPHFATGTPETNAPTSTLRPLI